VEKISWALFPASGWVTVHAGISAMISLLMEAFVPSVPPAKKGFKIVDPSLKP
jgi:hypothetical protein